MWTLYLINIVVFIGFLFLAWKKPALALILLLPTAAGMSLSGLIFFGGEAVDEGIVIFLLPIFLFPIALCLVHWSPSPSQLEIPWYKTVTSVILTMFMYLLILAVFVAVFQLFSIILFIVFLAAVYQFTQAKKFGLAMDIIATIGASIRQSLPLPTALTAAAHGQKKKAARVFNNIAHWLIQGRPLSEALRLGYPKCPSDILASITAGEKMDQLPKAIESLQADLSEKVNGCSIVRPVNPLYPCVVLVIAFTVVMGLTIFIVPTFADVLGDMSDGQASLPAITQTLLDFSNWMTARNGVNALLVFSLFLLVIVFVMHIRFRRRTPEEPRFLSRLGDRIKWFTPVLGWFEKTSGNHNLVRALRIGLIAGYPVNTILRNVLGLDVNACYLGCIKNWLNKIESGDNIAQSARSCGLDKTLAWAFDDTINKGNTPQILEGLEDVYRSKYNYRKNVLASASWPLIILGMGLIVGYVVCAMFMGTFSILTVTMQHVIPQ